MENKIMTLEEIRAAIEQGRALIAVLCKPGYKKFKSTPIEIDGDLIYTTRCCIPYSDVVEGVFKIYPVSR